MATCKERNIEMDSRITGNTKLKSRYKLKTEFLLLELGFPILPSVFQLYPSAEDVERIVVEKWANFTSNHDYPPCITISLPDPPAQ